MAAYLTVSSLVPYMSQFATTSGPALDQTSFSDIRIVPARDAQGYISVLEDKLKVLDGEHVYILDDGESGTSEGVFAELDKVIEKGNEFNNSDFVKLVNYLLERNHTIRIWEARNGRDDYLNVLECNSINELEKIMSEQYNVYNIRIAANKASKRAAGEVAT